MKEIRLGVRRWWNQVVQPFFIAVGQQWHRFLTLPGVHPVAKFFADFSTTGKTLFFTSILLLICALSFDWKETGAAGLAGFMLVIIALLWSLGRVAYRVKIEFSQGRVVAGETALGRIVLENSARRPIPSAVVEFPVGKGMGVFTAPALREGGQHEEDFTIPTARRGVIPVGPVRSVRADALSIVRRIQTWTDVFDLYIHPKTVRLDYDMVGFLRDAEGAVTQDLSSSDVAFHALRDYVPGDDRRSVHWRTTARTGRLMVRQFEETRRAHLMVLLSTNPTDWTDEEEFELGVQVAASLSVAAIQSSIQTTVLTSHQRLFAPSAVTLLDRFAEVETKIKGLEIPSLVEDATRRFPDPSVCVLVTGSAPSWRTLTSAMNRIPLNMRATALRMSAPGTKVTTRRVGPRVAIELGDLADLAVALRRAR